MIPYAFIATSFLALCCVETADAAPPSTSFGPVISPKDAAALMQAPPTKEHPLVILDTRSAQAFKKGHLVGAQPIAWMEFSASGKSHKGKLLRDHEILARKLGEKGVSNNATVLVVGDPLGGWGEEGRIVWMLRALGHTQSAMVDGGFKPLKKLGVKTKRGEASKATVRVFKASPNASGSATIEQIKASEATLLDTRERREFLGKTPYGESRGGHVPGAKHLYFKALLDKKGFILPKKQGLAKLKELGIEPGKKTVVTYCTGGVRSAWAALVLEHYGIQSKNYAGSMWEWAAKDAKGYPLVTGKE